MIRKFGAIAILLAAAIGLSACVVAEPGPVRVGCVPGHYGPYGAWHPGHC